MVWHLTIVGLLMLLAMVALLLLGIHMVVQPRVYVGRGPIPARDARNVRAMGALFAFLGGIVTASFAAPILLLS